MAKKYKMDNDRFLLTLAEMYEPNVSKANQTMTQLIAKLRDVFDEEQENKTDQVAVAMNEMETTVREIAENANQTASHASESRSTTEQNQG